MSRKVSSILICTVLAGISILSFLLPDRYFSVREKRKLQQLPAFSWAEGMDGNYCPKLEKYLLDQFPGRDAWITAKTVFELALGKRETGGVYVARDGYLMDAFTSFSQAQLKENAQQLCRLSESVKQEHPIPLSVLLVPTASEILSDKLPFLAPCADQQAIMDYLSDCGLDVVNVSSILRAHADEYLYYRTDHHYTSLGAWYCYCGWREFKGLAPENADLWTKEILCNRFLGTTWSKVGLPWTEPDTITGWYKHPLRTVTYNHTEKAESLYARSYLERGDPYAVFLNSNQPLTVIEGSGSSGSLLLIKDSFGNTFSQFPAEDYRQVHVIDLRFFHENVLDYIEQNGITEVLVLYSTQNFVNDTNLLF